MIAKTNITQVYLTESVGETRLSCFCSTLQQLLQTIYFFRHFGCFACLLCGKSNFEAILAPET
jgi:hypothetical protein